MANNINIVITAEDKASKPIRSISDEMDNASGKSSKFKGALSSLGGALARAAGGLVLAGGAAAGAGTALGFNFNSSVEQASAKLNAFMKDNDLVAKTLSWVKKEAADTQFSFVEMANAAADLTPVSKSTGVALEDLIKQAEILAALNPSEGLSGAVFSLREALSGDWVSIVDRFNLPRKRLNELREQGVPAMEAISTALGEMGIDYDLVSKQGETAAARWDQIKDKFTMAWGRATEPLFERISNGLNSLNNIDFDKLGENLANAFQVGLDAIDNVSGALQVLFTGQYKPEWFAGLDENHPVIKFFKDLHEAGKRAWEFIKPAFDELGRVFEEQLKPAFQDLWKEIEPHVLPALKALAYIVGGALLIGLLAITKTLTALTYVFSGIARATSWTIEQIEILADRWSSLSGKMSDAVETFKTRVENGISTVRNIFENLPFYLGAAVGSIASMFTQQLPQAMGTGVSQTSNVLGNFVNVTVPNAIQSMIQWFIQLPGRISGALSQMWAAAQGALATFFDNARVWAMNTVNSIVSIFTSIPERIASAFRQATGGIASWMSQFQAGFNMGNRPAYASGTNSAVGGWSRINEHGGEIVNLPRGSEVIPAYRSREMTQSRSGPAVIIENYHTHNQADEQRFLRDMGFYLELAS